MSMRVLAGNACVAVMAVLASATACSKTQNASDTAAAKPDTTTAAMATPITPTAAAPLNDANIAALLDEANAGDSTAGSVAASKATAASVKSFGRRMEREHHLLRKAGEDLVKKLNVTPTPPSGDTLASSSSKWVDSLNAMPKGSAWDQAYIDHEVGAHQAVMQLLQAADSAAQNADLKKLIEKAQPTIKSHLDMAQSIQSKLTGIASNTPNANGASADSTLHIDKVRPKKSAKKY